MHLRLYVQYTVHVQFARSDKTVKKKMTSSSSGVSGDAFCVYDSVIRGHHVYKTTWIPYIGEMLLARKTPLTLMTEGL